MKQATVTKGGKTPFAKPVETPEPKVNGVEVLPDDHPLPGEPADDGGVNFEADAGDGLHGHSTSDYKIPFLTLLQSMSPQCTEGDPSYDEKYRPGQVVNTVTGEVMEARNSKGAFLEITAVNRDTEYIEWKPRVKGQSGLVAIHKDKSILDSCERGTTEKDENKFFLANGNTVEETSKWFLLLHTATGVFKAVISMKGALLGTSRSWLTMIDSQRRKRADGSLFAPAMYARRWKLSSMSKTNAKGTFFIWNMEEGDWNNNPEAYQEAKQLRLAVNSGALALPDAPPTDALPAPGDENASY